MNSKIIYAATFITGVIVGCAAAWPLAKKKYEPIAQEEIDSVKKAQSNPGHKLRYREESPEERRKSIEQYKAIIKGNKYAEEGDMKKDGPYVIPPEDFGEFEDYEKISLTYYSDGVLTDENDEIMDDVEDSVGEDSLNHFGEYEDDSVFVRNDRKKCDYEILLDLRKYEDVVKTLPHRMEDE